MTTQASCERTEDEDPFVYQAGTMTITNHLAGTSKMVLTLDRRTGWLKHKERKTQLSGLMTRTQTDQSQPQSVSNVTLEITTRIELVE